MVQSTIKKTETQYRSNDQWLVELTGQSGEQAQRMAHSDLSAYLFVVIHNYLCRKYAKSTKFTALQDEDLATFVSDYVQDFMVKLMRDEYALLEKYAHRGRFTSWVAQIAHNLVGSDMRKAYWRRETAKPNEEIYELVYAETVSPEVVALRSAVGETLQLCLEKLPQNYRSVIERCVLLGDSATDIANEENVSPNSVYIRLHRAKEKLRKIAIAQGLEQDILGI